MTIKIRRFNMSMIATACAGALLMTAQTNTTQAASATNDLGEVLNQFATTANVEIMYAPELVTNRRVNKNQLTGAPRTRLSKILSGTGLTFEEPSEDVFIIRQASLNNTAPVAADSSTNSASPNTALRASAAQDSTNNTSQQDNINLEVPSGVVSGQVLDEVSGQPLAGAFVVLEGPNRVTSTDTRGFYRFANAPAGNYSIFVSYLGNETGSGRVNVESGETTTQNFTLASQIETVVVQGSRSSLQQALNQQRAADNSASIVSSDLLGSFPAETISEALRRVSGVSFSRDANTGEGDRISVRGFNDQAINIQLNGVDLQGTGVDRSVDLSGFLTDNIKQVTIQKSLLPSQEASGSGGLVEIETRSGLDYGDKYFSIAAEFENPADSAYGDEFEFSTTGAIRLTEDFGVSATVQYRETDAQNYNVNITQVITPVLPEGFTSLFRVPESFNYPFDSAIDTPLYTGTNYLSRQRDESNLTMSLNFAYDWADHSRLRLDIQSIQNDADFSTSRTTAAFLSSAIDMPIPEINNEVRRRNYIRAFRPTLGIDDNTENLTTQSISFRGETNFDNWEFDYTLGYSDVERDRLRNSISFLANQNTAVGDIIDQNTIELNTDDDANSTERVVGGAVVFQGDGVPVLSLSEMGQSLFTDPENYFGFLASQADVTDTTEAYVFEFDARRYFDKGPFEYLEIGTKYDDRTRSNSDNLLSTTNTRSLKTYTRIIGQEASISELNPGGFVSTNLSDIGLGQVIIPSVQVGSAVDFLNSIDSLTVDDPNTPENEARFTVIDRTNDDPIEVSGAATPALITEDIWAAYVETKAIFGNFDIIGGVRYQREKRTGNSISTPSIRLDEPGFRTVPREIFIDANLIDFVDTSNTQDTWTPSLIANYRPSNEIVIRGAYFRSTVNPSIDKIARAQQILLDLRPNFARATIREANPDLEPSKTDNYDLDFSYYFEDNPGLVRLGLFYKDISNNFTNTLVADEEATADIRTRVLAELAPLNAVDPAFLALPEDAEYFLQRPRNGEGGKIYGLEAEIIRQLDFFPKDWPAFIENFSVLGNVTYTKSEFEDLEQARNDDGEQVTIAIEGPLFRQPEWTGNASIRYEDGPFSGSLIYSYQAESASSYDEFNLNGIIPEFDTLDLRLSYTFQETNTRPQVIVFFEGDDMLTSSDEADIRNGIGSQFGDGSADYFFPTTMQFNGGRRFTVGAAVRF